MAENKKHHTTVEELHSQEECGLVSNGTSPLGSEARLKHLEKKCLALEGERKALAEELMQSKEDLRTAKMALTRERIEIWRGLAAATPSTSPVLTSRYDRSGPSSTPTTSRGLMTRGIPASPAKALNGGRQDLKTGMKKHEEVLCNYALVLHEPPRKVLGSLVGNLKARGLGGMRQEVVQQSAEYTVVHWKLIQDSRVSFDLLLSLDVKLEYVEGQEIINISLMTVSQDEIGVAVNPFEEVTDKTHILKVRKGDIVLAPEEHGQTNMTMRAEVSLGDGEVRAEKVCALDIDSHS